MKDTKQEAEYQDHPKDAEQCGTCSMYTGRRSCTAVAGEISPEGYCKHYKRGISRM